MNIKLVEKVQFPDLLERLRQVPLMSTDDDGSNILAYKNATISVRDHNARDVNPTTFYLLKKNLEFQKNLRECLRKEQGIDTLCLDYALVLEDENQKRHLLTPPIIEVTKRWVKFEALPGELSYDLPVRVSIPIINDGAHRVQLARMENNGNFRAIHIAGAHEAHPFYAHPNPWSQVKIVDDVPKEKKDKKLYSREDCYGLYRNFGTLGCGAPRGTGQ